MLYTLLNTDKKCLCTWWNFMWNVLQSIFLSNCTGSSFLNVSSMYKSYSILDYVRNIVLTFAERKLLNEKHCRQYSAILPRSPWKILYIFSMLISSVFTILESIYSLHDVACTYIYLVPRLYPNETFWKVCMFIIIVSINVYADKFIVNKCSKSKTLFLMLWLSNFIKLKSRDNSINSILLDETLCSLPKTGSHYK